jgi:hypothetical protein
MAKIEKTFTYPIPDDYLSQTRTLDKVGIWTYNGHDTIWVFVDQATNRLNGSFKTPDENGETYPTPVDQIKVKIDCNQDPLIACLVGADEIPDYAILDQHEETLPDGTVYTRPLVPPPDHTYEFLEIEYDPATQEFVKPYPWKKPHITWQDIREWRNRILAITDHREASDMTENLRAQWQQYRQALRDIPQTHGAAPGGTPITAPWKIKPFQAPDSTE